MNQNTEGNNQKVLYEGQSNVKLKAPSGAYTLTHSRWFRIVDSTTAGGAMTISTTTL